MRRLVAIAMTCAAIGAIYYGWSALSDVEREEMLDKLSKGLDAHFAERDR